MSGAVYYDCNFEFANLECGGKGKKFRPDRARLAQPNQTHNN